MNAGEITKKFLAVIMSVFLAAPASMVIAAVADSPSRVEHFPPASYVPGFRIELDADVRDESGVEVARCYFRSGKGKNFAFVDMAHISENTYRAQLPAPWINSGVVEYVFVVVNEEKGVTRTELYTMEEEDTGGVSSWQEFSDIQEVDLDEAQEAYEKYESLKDLLENKYGSELPECQSAASEGVINVNTEISSELVRMEGFYDNIILSEVPRAERYGLAVEGLYSGIETGAATSTAAVEEIVPATKAGTAAAGKSAAATAPASAASKGAAAGSLYPETGAAGVSAGASRGALYPETGAAASSSGVSQGSIYPEIAESGAQGIAGSSTGGTGISPEADMLARGSGSGLQPGTELTLPEGSLPGAGEGSAPGTAATGTSFWSTAWPWVIGGALVVGGVGAALAAGGGGGDGDDPGPGPTPEPVHRWRSWTVPNDPVRHQSVYVYVEVYEQGVVVHYEVSGTDGYTASGTMTSDSSGIATFTIPPSHAGHTYTIHVWVPSWGSGYTRTWSYVIHM